MSVIVQKYGGTSVGTLERIGNVARRVVDLYNRGNKVVVTVSAMSGETDRLINLAKAIVDPPPRRELDVLLNTGEQVSVALLAMAIEKLGPRSRSFLGHQIRITTDSMFSNAKILDIDTSELIRALDEGCIAVVAGFQGIDEKGNLTTLGRGGSDTTAVAIAAAIKADLCEILTDVDGVYTTDPNICPEARKLDEISDEEMLEMASLGAKVLHHRSVLFASKYKVKTCVRSSFNDNPGTLIVPSEEVMEQVVVRGITCEKNATKVRLIGVPDRPGVAAAIFSPISDAGINVDLIIQNASTDGFTDLTFTVPRADAQQAMAICQKVAGDLGALAVDSDAEIAKISIVGLGMRTHSGVASTLFQALSGAGINIQMVSTSEIKVTCVINLNDADEAVRVLHRAFRLDQPNGG
ncbi:MAG: aspartate kinase [Deltaproteobacteria bacterium]|nr:aspartate kinase [Deltaproteobacteria bacterium]